MNNELILTNYLMVLKSTIEVYIHGTIESSNEDIRKCLKYSLDEILKSQSRAYNKMVENGYYMIDNIESKSIIKVLKKLISKYEK